MFHHICVENFSVRFMSNKTKAFLESYPPGMIYNVRSRIFSLSESISKRDSEKLILPFRFRENFQESYETSF